MYVRRKVNSRSDERIILQTDKNIVLLEKDTKL
jgi:hypothetical protein